MALNDFESALADCRRAAGLQNADPSPKTLLRLAKCQFGVGSPSPALSTLRLLLSIEPSNAAAQELQKKASNLLVLIRGFHKAKKNKDWTTALSILHESQQSLKTERPGAPIKWSGWRIEIEMMMGDWISASGIAV